LTRDKTRPSRIAPLPAETVDRVVALTNQAPPHAATHWTASAMAKVAGISPSSVRRIWNRHGLQPHRVGRFKLSTDPHFVEKLRDVVGLYLHPPAKAVVVCANGAETPRLLLLSASKQFPNGLANSSGVVGKYLMTNSHALAFGVFDEPLNDYKGFAVSRVLHDFYELDAKKVGFYGGGGMDARFDFTPVAFASNGLPPETPRWGAGFKKALHQNFTRTMEIFCHGTSLAVESNSFSLDPDVKDAWGLPALRMTYKDHPDDVKLCEWMQHRALEILDASGAKTKWHIPVQEQQFAVHLLGTCRMGDDPKASVINPDHRTHDVPNLFLCDGSSLVTSGRGQPTLTIQALAYRAADRITALAKRAEILS
jgi:choline dehydrogenase-like flavoprotein